MTQGMGLTETLLYCTTALIGVCWIAAHWHAANREFPIAAQKRSWMIASTLLFLVIVSFNLTMGSSGLISDFDRLPPPFAAFLLFIFFAAFYCGFSQFGNALVKHTPMYLLVGFHAFRFLAEWILVEAYHEGLAPQQMTLEGYNFDIVTALTALPVAWIAKRNPSSKIVWAWNFMGLGFLAVVMSIALTSMPNEVAWVTRNPYILLPGVLVVAAIAGHFIALRKLRFLSRPVLHPVS